MNIKATQALTTGLLIAMLLAGCGVQPPDVQPRQVRPPDANVSPEIGQAVTREIDPQGRFTEANQRWAGAVCRLRFPTRVSEAGPFQAFAGRNHHPRAGSKDLFTKMLVNDQSALRPLTNDDVVLPGTEFLVRGWGPRERGGKKGAALYLRFTDVPVDARLIIAEAKTFGHLDNLSPKYFNEAEAFMRTEAFRCAFADEQLVNVPGTDSGMSPPADSTPALELTTVRLAPAEVASGGEINVILEYEVANLPAGSSVAVIEQRRLIRDGRELAVFDHEAQRTTGSFVSRQPLRVATDAPPGYYDVEGSAYIAGSTTSGKRSRAIFRVVNP